MELRFTVNIYQHRTPQETEAEIQFRNTLISQGEQIMATLAQIKAQLEQLKVTVQRTEDAEDSAIVLLQGITANNVVLQAKLDAAIASGDPAQLEAFSQELKDNNTALSDKTDKLAAAVVANTPAAGGGSTGTTTATIVSLSPSSVTAGRSSDVSLTVTGTGFVAGSIVQGDGVSKLTTFGDSTLLTATIPAADVAAVKSIAITVLNPDGTITGPVVLSVA